MADWTARMTTFDKREEAFEKRFALDEEERFKAVARRNKLLGLWAAEKLGKSGDQASDYARDMVASGLDGGDAGVLKKVTGDLAGKGVNEDALHAKFSEMTALAAAQIKA